MQSAEEFLTYIESLPSNLIKKDEEGRILFCQVRDPLSTCPHCGSMALQPQGYHNMKVVGLEEEAETYIYRRRRYMCKACKKTFYEQSPIMEWQDQINEKSWIRRFRERVTGVSQGEVFRKCGIPQYIYTALEKKAEAEEALAKLSIETLILLAHTLGTSVEEMYLNVKRESSV